MINTWNESLLHEELKDYYCGENGQKEVTISGSICDAVRQDGMIIEVQTANLGKLRRKIDKLLQNHSVTLVYPIAKNTIIETYGMDSVLVSRRKSPKHGTIFQLFRELTGIYHILGNPKFQLQVVFADIQEIRIADGTGSWRRKGIRRADKKLITIHDTRIFSGHGDYLALIPDSIPELFTVAQLREAGAGIHAGHMAWVLKKAEMIEFEGKKGNAFVYRRKRFN